MGEGRERGERREEVSDKKMTSVIARKAKKSGYKKNISRQ